MAIKQGDIPECLVLEPFRTAVLVQEVVVVAVLNGIERRICIATLLDEFTKILGGIRVRFPIAGSIDAPANTHPLCLLRSEDFLIGARFWPIGLCTFFCRICHNLCDNDGQHKGSGNNPGPAAGSPVPGLLLGLLLALGILSATFSGSGQFRTWFGVMGGVHQWPILEYQRLFYFKDLGGF